jgi:hypothetical protein
MPIPWLHSAAFLSRRRAYRVQQLLLVLRYVYVRFDHILDTLQPTGNVKSSVYRTNCTFGLYPSSGVSKKVDLLFRKPLHCTKILFLIHCAWQTFLVVYDVKLSRRLTLIISSRATSRVSWLNLPTFRRPSLSSSSGLWCYPMMGTEMVPETSVIFNSMTDREDFINTSGIFWWPLVWKM